MKIKSLIFIFILFAYEGADGASPCPKNLKGLSGPFHISPPKGRERDALIQFFERVFQFDGLNQVYAQAGPLSESSVYDWALKALAVELDFNREALSLVPRDGPLLIVANHPLSGVEAMAIGKALGERRSDLKIIGHEALTVIPELKSILIPVNPLSGETDLNRHGIFSLLRWISQGHSTLMFPSGWIHKPGDKNEQWSSSLGLIVRRVRPTILPVFFEGSPSIVFQMMQLINREFALLSTPREILRLKGSSVRFTIRNPIASQSLIDTHTTNEKIAHILKNITYGLPENSP